MSIFDQRQLLASIHPFDLLSERAQERLIEQMDIAYYPKETVLITPTVEAVSLYIIIKGSVNEYIEDELHNVYGEMDSFDANALIYGKTTSQFVVEEDVICYELPKEHFQNLIQDHEAFQSYFLEDFISKHQKLKKHQQQNDLTPFMVARIDEIYLHEPCIVSAELSIKETLIAMKALQTSVGIVERDGVYGIVTDTNLRNKVIIGGVSTDSPIGDIATFPLVTIDHKDFLFNALLLFTRYGIKRLVVESKGVVVGVLEQLDLLSFFANHSHLVVMQIEKADNIEELQKVGDDMLHLIRSLNSKGVKVRYISKLVNTLNAKIYEKVFTMSVPEEHREDCALIVMGSEGRNEQILRTDQDNGLIIADDQDPQSYVPYMQQLNNYLNMLGFPPCPGNIMVTNPFWRKSLHDYKAQIDTWLGSMDPEAMQQLAIFIDAQCIVGDARLLDEAKSYLYSKFEGRDDLMAHLAKAALSFDTPLSLFSGFVVEHSVHKNELDLKKGGIFAIVHGVRVLALQNRVTETNTTRRVKALNNMNVFDKEFSTELIEAYDTLLGTRMNARLSDAKGFQDINYVNPSNLNKIERDLLKDSFKVVNTFKKFLTFHFHINMVV